MAQQRFKAYHYYISFRCGRLVRGFGVPQLGRLEWQGCSACEEVARLSVFAPSMLRHVVVVAVKGEVVDNSHYRPL